jgi:hypothetical protein
MRLVQGVYRNTITFIKAVTAEVGGVDQSCSGRIEFGDKRVAWRLASTTNLA